MLCRLTVRNYALIESLEFEPGPGLNVMTGETGAGKSIILGALGLILGNRADSQSLRDPGKKCVIEGVFRVDLTVVNDFLTKNDLDINEELILRREILPGGKSRAFINDTPVGLNLLKEVGGMLVDIHSQHETLLVNESAFQLAVLDDYAGNRDILARYRHVYHAFREKEAVLHQLMADEEKALAERDYLVFQLEELTAASLANTRQEELEAELSLLEHAEEIKSKIAGTVSALTREEAGVLSVLAQQQSNLHHLAKFSAVYQDIDERFASCLIELKDIAAALERQHDSVHHDPGRAAGIADRLGLIYRLQQKHRTNSIDGLLAIQADLQQKTGAMDSLAILINEAQKMLIDLKTQLEDLARQLAVSRQHASAPVAAQLRNTLAILGIPDALIEVVLDETAEFTETGRNQVVFLFSANKGQAPRPVSKVASGGELSRLMLAIKSLIVHKTLIPVLIFDEIDTGVSGGIAARTGEVMRRMAGNMQVIAITHIPQIAAIGQHHFLVFKENVKGASQSFVSKLEPDQRVQAIAGMLSNRNVTEAAMAAAKQLLDSIVE